MIQPAEGTLDHPAMGQQYKFPGFFGAQHYCQTEFKSICNPVHKIAAVATIYPNLSQFLATTG